MNTTEVHPIELFLAALINLFELICWVINELSGHHPSPLARSLQAAPALTAPQSSPEIHPAKPKRSLITWGASATQTQPKPDLSALTVKQLQAATGVRSSRYRKADLIQLFIQQGEQVASDLALIHA